MAIHTLTLTDEQMETMGYALIQAKRVETERAGTRDELYRAERRLMARKIEELRNILDAAPAKAA